MKAIHGTIAFCLSLLLAVMSLCFGFANTFAAAAEENLAEKYALEKAIMLIDDAGADLRKLNAAIEATGVSAIPSEPDRLARNLARWLSADSQRRIVARHDAAAITHFMFAGISMVIAILIWLARPRAASST